ncbi:hypothetical protein Ccrd_018830 [Cynara cardunculus var. scolymus]|uniref:Thioredoxin domain-containing protein n=1 Tax=Cynara cardunculus var. scolymus TaxID=59895 RepID=A0A103Y5H6_CYNCS|nr:hypothetical protein Ccrd_018830 [Cynara cardunculus var. scolymus]
MGEEGQVISCHTVDAWNQQLQNGKNKLVLCFISYPDFMHSFNHTYWGVEAMPTFLLLKDGKTVSKVVGAKKEELQQTIIKHAGNSGSSS